MKWRESTRPTSDVDNLIACAEYDLIKGAVREEMSTIRGEDREQTCFTSSFRDAMAYIGRRISAYENMQCKKVPCTNDSFTTPPPDLNRKRKLEYDDVQSKDSAELVKLIGSEVLNERCLGAKHVRTMTRDVEKALWVMALRDESRDIWRKGKKVKKPPTPKSLAKLHIDDRLKWNDLRGDGNLCAVRVLHKFGVTGNRIQTIVYMASNHPIPEVRRECASIATHHRHDNVGVWLDGGDAFRLWGALESCNPKDFKSKMMAIQASKSLHKAFTNMHFPCSSLIIKRMAARS